MLEGYIKDSLRKQLIDKLWKHSMVGIAIVSKEGRFVKANDSYCRMLGYTEAELTTKKFQDITHPEDNLADVEMARQVASGEREAYDMPKRYIIKTTLFKWFLIRVFAIFENDEFVFFVTQCKDLEKLDITREEINNLVPKPKLSFKWIKENWVIIMMFFWFN